MKTKQASCWLIEEDRSVDRVILPVLLISPNIHVEASELNGQHLHYEDHCILFAVVDIVFFTLGFPF